MLCSRPLLQGSDSLYRHEAKLQQEIAFVLQDMILKGFDNECRKFIKNIYEEAGVTIHMFSSPKKLEKDSNGKLTLTFDTKEKEDETLADVDEVLFATGRKPNTKDLGLESAEVELDDKGGVKVSFFKSLGGLKQCTICCMAHE